MQYSQAVKFIKAGIGQFYMLCAAFLLLGLGEAQAQEASSSAGGEASGAGGTLSYTAGQAVYTTNVGAKASAAQGVQQVYSTHACIAIDKTEAFILRVYPNPTVDFLRLEVGDYKGGELIYRLYNLNGEVILNNSLSGSCTLINLAKLPASNYFLRVTDNRKTLKRSKSSGTKKNRINENIFTALMLVFVPAISLFAQSPERISYQAVVRDADNKPVIARPIGVQISILQGSPAGNTVYEETHRPTSNANGLISLEVGAGATPYGTFSEIDWASDTHFIKTGKFKLNSKLTVLFHLMIVKTRQL